MVQIVLLIMGIFYFRKRPKLRRLTAAEFPSVPSDRFEEWRALELASIDLFLWSTWGLAIIGTIVGHILAFALPGSGTGFILFYLLVFFGGLTLSAIKGSRAAKLEKSLGIVWPPKFT